MTFDKTFAIELCKKLSALSRKAIKPNVESRETDTQAHVEKLPDGRYLVLFPGTDSFADALTDLRVKKTDWGVGRVHEGFADAFASVRRDIMEILPPDAQIILSGHSLGGALATLAAGSLQGFANVVAVYTFGSPRVGNPAFVENYNNNFAQKTFRLVNSGDPVPKVPWMLGTYRHVDAQYYLAKDNTLIVDQALSVHGIELLNGWDALKFRPTPVQAVTKAFTIAKPHWITSYQAKLEALNEN